jgi:hypothetical protein
VPIFPSAEWFQSVADLAMRDETYRKFGRVDAIVGIIVGNKHYSLTFDVFDIRDIRETTRDELRDADFVLEMNYAQWRELIENIKQNGKADHDHTLNSLDLLLPDGLARNLTADGYRLDKFFRYNANLQRFFDLSAQIDSTFLPETEVIGTSTG